jgi:two-component system, chemotaxis family, sensor kinase CheA
MDMSQYRDLFVSEAREHLQKMGELLVALESTPDDRPAIDALFRSAHSLKGMAASMEYRAITELAHAIEDLMERVRAGLAVAGSLTDLLLEGVDSLTAMVLEVAAGAGAGPAPDDLIRRLKEYDPASEPAVPDRGQVVSTEGARPEVGAERWEAPQTVRIRTELLDRFVTTTGELITIKHRLASLAATCGSDGLTEAVRDLNRRLRELHDQVMAVRLIPLAAITDRFPRVVRDLAKKSGKEVSLVVQGADIELDRGILEELADPLLHILRNAVDHGIESPDQRRAAGKPPAGTIRLQVVRDKDQVTLTIVDDGQGIDPDRLVTAAVARGIITAEKAQLLPLREILMLVCQPGFSTAEQVTEVSGRGVGMDAVRTTLKSLSGTLAIESEVGRGTRFILKVPSTIAIINVLLVAVGRLTAAIPVSSIQRTLELKRSLIQSNGKQQLFICDEEQLPLLSLNRLLGEPQVRRSGEVVPLFVCELKGRRVGIVIDRFVGHQEVFVKPLGRPLSRLKGLAGGAVLGGGEIVFLLDVPNLL